MATVGILDSSWHVNDNLIVKWDKLKEGKLFKLDEDRVYVTDGRERSGKSLFTIQQVAYIDPTIIEDEDDGKILPKIPIGNAKSWDTNSEWSKEVKKRFQEGTLLPRITFNSTETLKSIRNNKSDTKSTKVVLFDEAFRGMSSKGVLSKENKTLVQVLMEMGQSNLVLWIVSPSFFLLELYPAMLRSNALFHVNKSKRSKKRVVRIFNYKQKAMLYQIGLRKGWGYPIRTKEAVNFYNNYPGGQDFEWRYRLKKQLSLKDENVKDDKKEDHKWKQERDILLNLIYTEMKSLRKMSEMLKEKGITLSANQIGLLVKAIDKKTDDSEQKVPNLD